ncbi:hypothetical protein [Paraburkholderia rhynchosiae]|uniref:Uncharacterized protein n=1 Tax=Paraburkholderia rhynchosiae TaxID=487049 RepID=A0A6J5BKN7_9BURK|nr:hypothetical protein [Paraburkholderia rhynchosiae]CAB3710305.1 hypothetical protein LMG27174_04199 [Paraburkholderia rhynchosiae]
MTLLDMGLGLATLVVGLFFFALRATHAHAASRFSRFSRATMVRETIPGEVEQANGNPL